MATHKSTTKSQAPPISVVVLTKDRPRQLSMCLWSLTKQDYQNEAPFEIIVVNDNSNRVPIDNTSREVLYTWARRYGTEYRIVGGDGTLGMAKARNLGISSARYNWILKLDDDHYCDSDMLSVLAQHVAPDVGAVGAVFPFVYNRLPLLEVAENPDYIGKVDIAHRTIDKSHEFGQLLPMMHGTPVEADLLRGIYLHRKLPGVRFDETLSKVSHTEDTRFSWAIKCRGYRLLVAGDAMCWHFQAATGGARYPDADIQRQRDQLSFWSYMEATWTNRTNLQAS